MSQPSAPGLPPEPLPPVSYGGYGGELQSFGQGGYAPIPQPAPQLPTPTYPTYGPAPVLDVRADAALAESASRPPQRPVVIGLATTLAATASLQWVCVLSFLWLVATAGASELGTTGVDGGLFHILNRFNYRMLDGLAWPLYLFPVASFVLSFLLLTRRPWARLAFTILGVAVLGWSAVWLRNDLLWWLVPAVYVAVSVLVLWTTDATRWYRWRSASDPARQPY